jgi:iron-sulfur cluster repair protein YtfE (RIC family)
MDEHDRLRELGEHIRRHLAAGDDAAARDDFDRLLLVLGPHVAREEGALFPRLRQVEELTAHVRVLESEHASLYDTVDDLDDLPAAAAQRWRDGVRLVLRELDEHMYKEDFGLFPAALATLDGSDWDAVDQWEAEHSPTAAPTS